MGNNSGLLNPSTGIARTMPTLAKGLTYILQLHQYYAFKLVLWPYCEHNYGLLVSLCGLTKCNLLSN